MELNDIREIIKLQLAELGIEANDTHYEVSYDYYDRYNQLPDVNYLLDHLPDNDTVVIMSDSSSDEPSDSSDDYSSDDEIDDIIELESCIINAYNQFEKQSTVYDANVSDVLKVIEDINEIPLQMYKNIDIQNSGCLMCYDPFVPTDLIRMLSCKHLFHMHCIDNHLENISHLCPYCRTPVGKHTLINK